MKCIFHQMASVMEVLQTHGALKEYTLIQKRHLDTVNELNSIIATIENLKSCETGLSQLKIDQELLQQKARQDYDERRAVWEKPVELFNKYTEQLYNAPGRLVIDVGPNGFKFDVEIERSNSGGIGTRDDVAAPVRHDWHRPSQLITRASVTAATLPLT